VTVIGYSYSMLAVRHGNLPHKLSLRQKVAESAMTTSYAFVQYLEYVG